MVRIAITSLLASAAVLSAPPEEIRIGSLGPRGVAFTEERPGTFDNGVAAAGDVNGDGRGDFLLVHLDIAADFEPTVFLVYGKAELPESITASELKGFATTFRRSTPRFRPDDLFVGVEPAGDSDGDGFDDFFIFRPEGAPEGWVGDSADALPGLVYLVHGAATLPPEVGLDTPPPGVRITLFTSTKDGRTGLGSSASVGDLNGDGTVDFAFGASGSRLEDSDIEDGPGRVYVLFGGAPFTGLVDVEEAGRSRPGVILDGDEAAAGMGWSVAFTDDVNGDGLGDLLVGARSGLGWRPSWAYLVLGASTFPRILTVSDLVAGNGVRFTGTTTSFTGEALAAPGDVTGDGLADLVIGAPGANAQAGGVYLVPGRRDFDSDIQLAQIDAAGLGVTFRGELGDGHGGDQAGSSVAAVDFLGSGKRDIVLCAWGAVDRGISAIGKVYVISGRASEPGPRSLAEVEQGTLPGALITTEVSLTSAQRYAPELGTTVAAAGDVNGDGREDLLISAPSDPSPFNDSKAGWVYLVYGRGGVADPLRLERVEPDTAAVAGGAELSLIGAGLDETVEVRIGGVIAPVQRAITSARLVVKAPPLAQTGPTDVVASRGPETTTLPGGVRYVARVHPDIDLLELAEAGKGIVIRGTSNNFGLSIAFFDMDQDGFSDVVASSVTGSLVVIYGTARPAGTLELPDLEGGERLEGVSLIRTPPRPSFALIGDVSGDGKPDLAVSWDAAVTLLFTDGRFPDDTDLDSLVAEGRGTNILNGGPAVRAVAGGGDLDGDGIGDLVVATGDYIVPGSFAVYLILGFKVWPRELFLEDLPRVTSTQPEDYFGVALAVPGDIDGDGLVDVLAGAPGPDCCQDGNGYLLFGGAWPETESRTVQDLLGSGGAARLDPLKEKDGIGYRVCAAGDVNGDGVPDLGLSALGGGVGRQGECYSVFGGGDLRKEPGGVVLSMAALGDRGLRILGEQPYDSAVYVAPAGDFNGDGLADLLVGAPTPKEAQGKAYVVFGGPARTVRLDDLGADGVRIQGAGLFKLGSRVLGGGDFNGDGRDDSIVVQIPRQPLPAALFIIFGEEAPGTFIRGDSNRDGKVQLSDAVHLLGYLFLGSDSPTCRDAADGNDDGKLDLTDAVYVLAHLFLGGPAPPAPFPAKGTDPSADTLDCEGPNRRILPGVRRDPLAAALDALSLPVPTA